MYLQSRYKVIPLTTFYILTTVNDMLRIVCFYYTITIIKDRSYTGLLTPAFLKLATGVT